MNKKHTRIRAGRQQSAFQPETEDNRGTVPSLLAGKWYKFIIIFLCFVLICNLLLLADRIDIAGDDYYYEYSEMMRTLESGDYAELEHMVLLNDASGASPQKDTSEFTTFVRFYEATILYEAYQRCGETEMAAQEKSIMDENHGRLQTEEIIHAADDFAESFD